AAERQDLEAPAKLLDAGAGCAAHAMGVDLVEAVAVLAHRVADRVGAIPEGAVEDAHVLVDQRLFVALEQRAHLGHDVGEIGREIAHVAPVRASAMPTSRASAPGAATMERPTGRPSTVDPGRLTCGTPVRPPWAHRHKMRSRTGWSADWAWPV